MFILTCLLNMLNSHKEKMLPNQSLNWMDLGNAGQWKDWISHKDGGCLVPPSYLTQIHGWFERFQIVNEATMDGNMESWYRGPTSTAEVVTHRTSFYKLSLLLLVLCFSLTHRVLQIQALIWHNKVRRHTQEFITHGFFHGFWWIFLC